MSYSYPINPECKSCKLSTKNSVPGQAICSQEQVKLIVVGSYPKGSDEICDRSFSIASVGGFEARESYGEFMVKCFTKLLGEDFIKRIYFTHAIKCSKRKESITQKERDVCHKKWIIPELEEFNADIPIFLMGTEAIKAVLGKKANLADNRGKLLHWQKHRVIVTFDPGTIQESMVNKLSGTPESLYQDLGYLYEQHRASRNNIDKLTRVHTWKPVLPGTMAWFFAQDLKLLKNSL